MNEKPVMDAEARRKAIDEIVHGTFLMEGTMVAFPTCFPGVTTALPPDESLITALALGNDAIVYGVTSGHRAHLLAGMFHGLTGIIYDLGAPEGMTEGVAVGCTSKQVIAAFNGPSGGCLVRRNLQGLPFDLLQEWGFERLALDILEPAAGGAAIVDGVLADDATFVVATAEKLAAVDVAAGTSRLVADLEQPTRLALAGDGAVLGSSGKALWRYHPQTGFEADAVVLPDGNWEELVWQRSLPDAQGGNYLADGNGGLYRLSGSKLSERLGQIPLTPVGAMATTYDGRLYGTCGEGIANLFVYQPADGTLRNLGVAASVIERRRYGYTFSCAVTGRDGEIVFGENDNAGHMWLYFPRIQRCEG
ncbi:MAG: hypothetical protein GXY52_08780 [Chloroflexi bacterium]|nr:hypothetical protein [Chloroflexota bacterium]